MIIGILTMHDEAAIVLAKIVGGRGVKEEWLSIVAGDGKGASVSRLPVENLACPLFCYFVLVPLVSGR